jgi:hypothetical protein
VACPLATPLASKDPRRVRARVKEMGEHFEERKLNTTARRAKELDRGISSPPEQRLVLGETFLRFAVYTSQCPLVKRRIVDGTTRRLD